MPVIQTPLTRLLRVDLPRGATGGATGHALAVAFSNARGLGMLAVSLQGPFVR